MSKVVVLFEVVPKEDGLEKFFQHVGDLLPIVSKMDGFISAENYQSLSDEKKYFNMSVWDSEENAAKWRNTMDHRQRQKDGHDNLFDHYKLTVASINREYTGEDRENAPADSNDFLCVE